MKNNVFKDKKVLVTGHTGFKGAWLSFYLYLLGSKYLLSQWSAVHSS